MVFQIQAVSSNVVKVQVILIANSHMRKCMVLES